jgi:serine/threonine protein kinase
MKDRSGQQVDRYRLLRLLGSGGFGEVYLAEHIRQQTQVAIKLLPPLAADDLHSFLTEARMFRLRHPHIVQILDFGLDDRTPFLVMEYAPHGTLRQRYPKGTCVPLPVIVATVKQAASALQLAHDDGIIHRDVKPENMLLNERDEVLLSDFGIASIALKIGTHTSRHIVGTTTYMAPELFRGKAKPASDQYALGVVVYEWLGGLPPFSEGNFIQLGYQHTYQPPPSLLEKVPSLSPDIEKAVMIALAKDEMQRFASVRAFSTALEEASRVLVAPVISPLAISAPSPAQETEPPARPVEAVKHGQPEARIEEAAPLVTEPVASLLSTVRFPELPVRMPEHSAASALQPIRTFPFPQVIPDVAAETPSVEASRKSAPRQGHISTRRTLLLLGLLLLLLFASASVWLTAQYQQDQTHQQVTATAQVRASATAHVEATQTTIAAPTATATAAIGAYDTAIATQGIMFGFDAAHSHFNPYEQFLSPATVPHLKQAWTAATGDAIFSSPAVANGVVYVGSDDGKLYAFKAEGCGQASCTPLWTAATGNGIDSSPAVANGVVYVGSTDY